jgi:hypothetical protein
MPNILTTGKSRTGRTSFELLGLSYDPTLGEVVSAGFNSALEGPGSAVQDVAAQEISKELGRPDETGIIQGFSTVLNTTLFGALSEDTSQTPSVSLDEESWKNSQYFRDGIDYQVGMTSRAAEILANRHDRQADRDFVLSQSSGLVEGTAMYVGGFGGAMADAKNVAVSVGVGVATPIIAGGFTAPAAPVVGAGAGLLAGTLKVVTRAAPTLKRLNSVGLATLRASRRARFTAAMAEATVSTVPQVATGLQNADLLQEQYNADDAALDFIASVGLSAGLWRAGEAVRSAWTRYATPDAMTEVGQLVMRQVEMGERIDVQPLIASKIADFTPSRVDVPEPSIRKLDTAMWEATSGPDIFIGKTQAEVEAKAREAALSDSIEPLRQAGFSPRALAQIQDALEIKMRRAPEQVEADVIASIPEVKKARAELATAEQAFANASKSRLKVAEKLRDSARQRVSAAEEAVRPRVRKIVEENLQVFEKEVAAADARIREIQVREAARLAPAFAKRQLDMSVEAQAARSIDPEASRIVAEETPNVKFEEDTPPPAADAEAVARLKASLGDTPSDQSLTKALAQLDAMRDIPAAVERFIQCRAGR